MNIPDLIRTVCDAYEVASGHRATTVYLGVEEHDALDRWWEEYPGPKFETAATGSGVQVGGREVLRADVESGIAVHSGVDPQGAGAYPPAP